MSCMLFIINGLLCASEGEGESVFGGQIGDKCHGQFILTAARPHAKLARTGGSAKGVINPAFLVTKAT